MIEPGDSDLSPDAREAHQRAIDAGEQGYLDPTSGLFVMTSAYLATRPCCDNRCRHCPWGPEGQKTVLIEHDPATYPNW